MSTPLKRLLTGILSIVLFGYLFSSVPEVQALEVPSAPKGRVSDYTGTLDREQIQELEAILAQLEQDTTNQIAVVLIPTLEGDSLEDYSIRLAEKWQIGQKGKDNGVILLIVKQDREIRMEVGYGLEGALPDGLAGEIIRRDIAPRFREGDFYGGIRAGVLKIIAATKGEYQATPSEERDRGSGFPFYLLWVALVILVFLPVWRQRRSTRRPYPGFYGGGFAAGGYRGGFAGGGFGGMGGFSGGGGGFGGGGASGGW